MNLKQRKNEKTITFKSAQEKAEMWSLMEMRIKMSLPLTHKEFSQILKKGVQANEI